MAQPTRIILENKIKNPNSPINNFSHEVYDNNLKNLARGKAPRPANIEIIKAMLSPIQDLFSHKRSHTYIWVSTSSHCSNGRCKKKFPTTKQTQSSSLDSLKHKIKTLNTIIKPNITCAYYVAPFFKPNIKVISIN